MTSSGTNEARLTQVQSTNAAIRERIKAQAKKEDGHAFYGPLPAAYYRLGQIYPEGTIIKVRLDEDPSVTWPPYTGDSTAAVDVCAREHGASAWSEQPQ